MWQKIKNLKFVNYFWFIFYLVIFIILLKNGFSYLDPDFGWHLKAGEEVALSGQAPTVNLYNYTYTGDWVNHEWLSDWALYYFYQNFGYIFIVIIFALLIVTVLVILNIFIYKNARGKILWPVLAGFQFFGLIASLPHLGVRLQELAWLFILAIFIIIYYFQKTNNWRYLLFLPPLMLAWANLHGSFLIGFFLLGSYFGIQLFIKLFSKSKFNKFILLDDKLDWKNIKIFALISILSFLATLINPYGLGLYEFLNGYRNTAYLSLIREWLPQYSFPFFYSQLFYLALGIVGVTIYSLERIRAKKSVDLWSLFLVITFFFFAFKSRRHFPLFFVVTLPFLVNFNSEFFSPIKIAYQRLLKYLVVFCLLMIAVSNLLMIQFTNKPFSSYCDKYPCEALSFLKENPQYSEYNIFNSYIWGGYLIWNYPAKKIFIDGRLPQVNFAGKSFVEEFADFFKEETDHKNKLATYDIRFILLEAEDYSATLSKWEKIFLQHKDEDYKIRNGLRNYLENSSAWSKIYQDQTAVIYVLGD